MTELSQFAPSDFESDQSDIELHYTRRSLATPTKTEVPLSKHLFHLWL